MVPAEVKTLQASVQTHTHTHHCSFGGADKHLIKDLFPDNPDASDPAPHCKRCDSDCVSAHVLGPLFVRQR